ncbi:serine/threonine-protein kinase [Nonomuraea cypriaca]|uniref:serine/threonine-protein kinase n=1 Tax=Nonomuraea cypriaca TaxID=1187855 RepID=UPI0022A868F3|nr:serine/threonine-protein kinase [Nonomuraea cypriaca]
MSDSAGPAGLVGGRYRLLRTIGQGGMGTVWQAHDEVLGRDVAVKEVLPSRDLSEPEREEFAVRTFREARAAGRVAHPGVAAVYDVLEERGHPWIVMQLVHSRTLGELIRDDGPMPPMAAANVGLQLLEALRAAHAAGVLHRDVKPDNVLLTRDGRAVLTDFGIATTEDEDPVTRTGVLIGTPAFMAPERAAGGGARPASDLWSLGVTLYMAVEGHSPFHRDNALATLGAVMHAEPEPLARAGVLAPVLLGLLRKNPAERMTLEEAERRVTAILAGGAPERTGPVTVPEPARRRRRPPMAAVGAGALAVAVITGGAAWWSTRPGDTVRTPLPGPAVVTTFTTAPPSPSPEAPSPETPSPEAPSSEPPSMTESTSPPTREQPRSPSEKPTESETREESPSETPGQVDPSDNEGTGSEEESGQNEGPGGGNASGQGGRQTGKRT